MDVFQKVGILLQRRKLEDVFKKTTTESLLIVLEMIYSEIESRKDKDK